MGICRNKQPARLLGHHGQRQEGCLDGNNINIFEGPPHANEFVLWSVYTSPGADSRHNLWSGVHIPLSAEIIARSQLIDGPIVWDMVYGTIGRPCQKIIGKDASSTKWDHIGCQRHASIFFPLA